MRRTLPVLLLALALPATAAGEGLPTIEQAREAHGATKPATTVADGDVTVTPTEGIASVTRTVEIRVREGAPIAVAFPVRFSQRSLNGHAFVSGRPSAGSVDAGGTLSIDVSGLPAGTYRMPLRRAGSPIGTAVFRLYAARRDGDEGDEGGASGPFGRIGRMQIDSSGDLTEESETFIAVNPANSNQIVTSANDISSPSGRGGVSVTTDGGAHWGHPLFPTQFKRKGQALTETQIPSGDPILAADALGDVWAGGLSVCANTSQTHAQIFVNRLVPATSTTTFTATANVALPILHGDCNAIQDKPQMTIDTKATSPTFGRLYVTWDDPDPLGATNLVAAYCDTQPLVSACDDPIAWKGPVVISGPPGSYISSDPAVGPDGRVYVAWWDYSATNAIAIDSCAPVSLTHHCDQAGDWGQDKIVASLSNHFGRGVPFACPTLAQPGGRAAPVPSIAVDHSGGANNGRIYAAWSDLGTTGTLRCDVGFSGNQISATLPDSGQDAWNSYVASALTLDTLTNDPTTSSGARGTNIVDDLGDHWFPWVAVDQSAGQAYVDLYSTRDDASRRSANFYVRAVVPGAGTGVQYGALALASDEPTNYSDQSCGDFGNDYGDYSGLDAAGGFAFPVWTHRVLGGDGDVYMNALQPATALPQTPADNPVLPPPSPRLAQCEPPLPPTTTATTPPPPPPPTTTTTPTTPTPDRKAPILKITFATRVDRKGRYTLKLAPAGEPAAGSATLRLAGGKRRKLASGLLATSGNKSLKLVIRLKRKDLALLKRKHKLRVKLTVSLSDVAGNTARGSKTFTLRLRR